MINPLRFLWKQLGGPQISAFCQGIYEYFKYTYDSTMDYLYTLKISTATSKHLTTIGALQGLARPIVEVQTDPYSIFSTIAQPPEDNYYPHDPYRQSEHGLSDLADMSFGGLFSEVGDTATFANSYISDSIFRTILKASSASMAKPGSLAWLDDIIYALWLQQHSTGLDAPYVFDFMDAEEAAATHRGQGDLRVNIGNEVYWAQGYEIVAELSVLGKTIYYPNPTVLAEMDT